MVCVKRGIFALILVPSVAISKAWAAAGWDCRPGKDGKEWVCVAGRPKATEPAAPEKAAAEPEPQVETAGPERPQETVEPTEPLKPSEPPVPQLARPLPAAEPEVFKEAEAKLKRLPQTVATPEVPSRSVDETKERGWNCRPGVGKEWDCALVGADPKGLPHVVGEGREEAADWTESGTITSEDEQRFQSVMARLPENPWTYFCSRPGKSEWTQATQFLMTPADRLARETVPLEIHSDSAELIHEELANFRGTAEVSRADQRLWGDFISHNTEAETLNAQGSVIYQEKGLAFASDTAFLKLKTDEGVLRNSQFVLKTVPARGTSRVTHIDSKTLSRYETVTYTSCPPGNQDWLLHASKAKINKETGVGSAENAWLEFKGVPFLYTPYISFPVDDRRKTGFLSPSFGTTKVSGFNLMLPYYFNLAPNYDLTFNPRYLTNRGALMGADFRYLTDWTRGRTLLEYMPYDDLREEARGQIGFLNDSRFTDNLNSHLDLHYVSDDRYLNELGSILHINDRRNIRSQGSLNYSGENYSISARGDYFQTLDPTITPLGRPYWRLPQLLFNYGRHIADSDVMFQGYAEMVNFQHDGTVNVINEQGEVTEQNRVTAQRINLRPKVYYPLQGAAGFIIPSLTLEHTQYWLKDQAPGVNDSISRTAPIFSLDTGTYFDRDLELFNKPMQHTIEPRLFYLYVPTINQRDIPIFDSSEYDFNFSQLFRENRFAGADRRADANQLTAALTSRLIDQESGLERLRLSLGSIIYFKDREVPLIYRNSRTPAATEIITQRNTSSTSNLVAEASSWLTDDWLFRATAQYNPDTNQIDRNQVGIQYNNKANEILNLAYRYRRPSTVTANQAPIDQTDISFRLPVAEGWHLIGQWQYLLNEQKTSQTFFGIERETCCWRFSLVGLRYLNNTTTSARDPDVSYNNGIFFQLELKGLTILGNEVDDFLYRSIPGFRQRDEIVWSNP